MKSRFFLLILTGWFLIIECKKTDQPNGPGGGGGDPAKIEMGNTPWPSFYQNMQGTNISSCNGPTTLPTQKWSVKLSDQMLKSCILGADGTIFVCSQDKLFAVASNGTLKWTFDASMFITSSPVIDRNGVVYISGFAMGATSELSGYVYAINATDGTKKWKFTSPNAVDGGFYDSPTIGLEGYLYVPEKLTKTLYALNNAGEIAWSYQAAYMLTGTPVIGTDSTIYQSAYQGSELKGALYAIKPGGKLQWTHSVSGEFTPAAILPNGNICVGGGVYMYWLKPDKTIKSSRNMQNTTSLLKHFAVGKDNVVYMTGHTSNYNNLYALDSGLEKYWNEYGGVPVLGNDGILYLTYDTRIIACNSTTGVKVWQYDLPASSNNGVSKAIIGNDGRIYVGLSNGSLLALGN